MEDSLSRGVMAAFAVSSGVVFIAMQAHKRLLSDFINKMEFHQIKTPTGALRDVSKKKKQKKKVRFADDFAAESTLRKADRKKIPAAVAGRRNDERLEGMPQNWQVLYKGILQSRNVH